MASIDNFMQVNIYSSNLLSIDDFGSLTLLYMPVVGPTTIMIYETLYSLIDRSSLKSSDLIYKNILDLLQMDDKTFYESRRKLEALGLIETLSSEKEYVFLLKQPLTPKQFLQDSIFNLYLGEALGEEMYKKITSKFVVAKVNRLDFKNISATFTEVFKTLDDTNKYNADGFIMGRKPNGSINFKPHSFNYDEFLTKVDATLIPDIKYNETKQVIVRISYLYGYDESTMASLFSEALNDEGVFDSKILSKKAELLHKHITKGKVKNLETPDISQDEYNAMIAVSNASVSQMLEEIWPDSDKSNLKSVNTLYVDSEINLTPDVLNIMVYYVLKQKNGELPPAPYFKKVAKDWISKGIVTKEDAWKFARGIKDNTLANKKYSKPINKKSNEYSDDYIKKLDEGFESL